MIVMSVQSKYPFFSNSSRSTALFSPHITILLCVMCTCARRKFQSRKSETIFGTYNHLFHAFVASVSTSIWHRTIVILKIQSKPTAQKQQQQQERTKKPIYYVVYARHWHRNEK